MINGIQGGNSGAITPPKHNRRFAKLDKNGDGGLDESELAGMAKRTGKDASKLLSELDANNDGKVDSGEMDAARAKHRAASRHPSDAADQFTTSLMNILKQLQGGDKDKDGSADAFSKLDADGDGKLSPSEFAAGMAPGNNGAGQNLQAAAKEFTTSLMNLFSQLQGSNGGAGGAKAQAVG